MVNIAVDDLDIKDFVPRQNTPVRTLSPLFRKERCRVQNDIIPVHREDFCLKFTQISILIIQFSGHDRTGIQHICSFLLPEPVTAPAIFLYNVAAAISFEKLLQLIDLLSELLSHIAVTYRQP